jgi:hypothetical protein
VVEGVEREGQEMSDVIAGMMVGGLFYIGIALFYVAAAIREWGRRVDRHE